MPDTSLDAGVTVVNKQLIIVRGERLKSVNKKVSGGGDVTVTGGATLVRWCQKWPSEPPDCITSVGSGEESALLTK